MAAVDPENDRASFDIQRQYAEFLEDSSADFSGPVSNHDLIKDMIRKKQTRVIVNINDLRKKNIDRCIRLLENGFEEMPLFNKALREVVASIDQDYAKEREEFFIGLEGSFGAKHVTPRTLTSRYLGNTVCVEGIVTKCTSVCPKVVRSVHYCPATKKSIERRYADITSFDVIPTANVYPTKDDDGNLLETEYGLSKYRDHQTITLQEMPERAPTGQLPRSVEVVLDNDLVDECKPGDRILVIGVYRCLPGKQGGVTSGVFKSVLLGVHIISLSKDANLVITHDDVNQCKKFSRTPNPFEALAKSLAPSIHGLDYEKKALLCLLLGGEEKILPNGTRLRGDINILLIGDPSVAKSQMLRYVANIGPRVIMTTGRGSSGVGLTAAVTTDFETGERRLEAGAMVLADRGIVCIDEFDKMSDSDRTAIHEVMEQGRVTISKAGIHARLNARTSVLAAANPIMGRYDDFKTPMENIALQDSLLSRFDLLFIIQDKNDKDHDRKVADHVLRMNRYRAPNEQDGDATPLFTTDMSFSTRVETDKENQTKSKVFEKHNPLLHGRTRTKLLSMDFIKKYIHIARIVKPKLTPESAQIISDEYIKLRADETETPVGGIKTEKTEPVTARTLETLIRLSTAHARSRMSKVIEKKDCSAIIEIVRYALFKGVREKLKKKRAAQSDSEEDIEEEEMELDDDAGENGAESEAATADGTQSSSSGKRKTKRTRFEDETTAADTMMDTDSSDLTSATVAQAPPLDPARYTAFSKKFSDVFHQERLESLPRPTIEEYMVKEGFTTEEIDAGIKELEEKNILMISENFIFMI